MTDDPILPDAEDAPEVEPVPEPDSHDDAERDVATVTVTGGPVTTLSQSHDGLTWTWTTIGSPEAA